MEALPIGNGRMGAMVFGGPEREQLQLNEDTLYSGEPPADLRSIDIKKSLPHVIQLIRDNKHAEADAYVMKHWLGRNQQCYQPLGDLFLEFPAQGKGRSTGYRRWLDIGTATAGVSFQRGGVTFTREIFASHPDQVIVVRLRADKPGALAFTARFASVHPTAKSTVATQKDQQQLVLRGQLPGFVARRPMKTIEEWGDQHKYPELYDKQGKRLPHAKQVLYGKDIGDKGMFFEARLGVRTDGKLLRRRGRLAARGRAPPRRCCCWPPAAASTATPRAPAGRAWTLPDGPPRDVRARPAAGLRRPAQAPRRRPPGAVRPGVAAPGRRSRQAEAAHRSAAGGVPRRPAIPTWRR